ncbi:MAG: hypothetical protein CSA66_06440 [Proteobacteria bacterium]|nr:MAG: hypothetical protein CSA66_06440 [Pseudomonadota bacterium]
MLALEQEPPLVGRVPRPVALALEVGAPGALEAVKGQAADLAHRLAVALALRHEADQIGGDVALVAVVEELDDREDLGKGGACGLLAGKLRHRRAHLLEGDEAVFSQGVGEEGLAVAAKLGLEVLALPGGLVVLGQPLVQPQRHGVAALLRDEQVDHLVGEGVEPVVAVDEVSGRGDHQPVVLAQGDGARGADLGDRQRAHRAQDVDGRVELDAQGGVRGVVEDARQLGERLGQRVFGQRDEDLIDAWRVADDEAAVGRLVADVVAGLALDGLGQLEVAGGQGRRARVDRLAEVLDGLGVAPTHQVQVPCQEQVLRVVGRLGVEALDEPLGGHHVPGRQGVFYAPLERALAGLGGDGGHRHEGDGAQGSSQGAADHFISPL